MVTALILLICSFIGLILSGYMTLKYHRLSGQSPGQSVVQTPYARVFGLPNSLYGMIYYSVIAAISIYRLAAGRWTALLPAAIIAIFAAVFSLYLAWSLLFKLKEPCPICYTTHIINIVIAVVLAVVAN